MGKGEIKDVKSLGMDNGRMEPRITTLETGKDGKQKAEY